MRLLGKRLLQSWNNFIIQVFLSVLLGCYVMGISDERFIKIMQREIRREMDPENEGLFSNRLPCEYSGICLMEGYRLSTLPKLRGGRKSCSRNPGREECIMYQFLEFVRSSE